MKQSNKFAENMDFCKKTGYGMTHTLQGNSQVRQVTYGHYLKRYVDFENQKTYLSNGEDTVKISYVILKKLALYMLLWKSMNAETLQPEPS